MTYGMIDWNIEKALHHSNSKYKAAALNNKSDFARQKNYELSYLAIRQFAECDDYDTGRLRLLLNLTYGWMPRVARIADESVEPEIIKGLNRVRLKLPLTAPQLTHLITMGKAYMGSVVGFSKMLHFVADDRFAIFDSRVLSAFVPFESTEKDEQKLKKDFANYRAYLQRTANSVENYIGYNNAIVEFATANKLSLRTVEKQLFGTLAEELA